MSDTFRKIALRLNELHRTDRDWMLGQLPEDARARVAPLLRELSALGADELPASTFDELVASAGRGPKPASKPAVETPDVSSGIAHADHASMHALLADEPDWVIALVVNHSEWPWLDDFIEALPPERVGELHVTARELDAVVKPRVKDAILHALGGRLPDAATREQPSRFDRLVAHLGYDADFQAHRERRQ